MAKRAYNCAQISFLLGLMLVSPLIVASPTPTSSADELIRQAVDNEIKAAHGSLNNTFLQTKSDEHGSETKRMVGTRDCMASLLVAVNGKPLSPAQQKAEEERLDHFMRDPAEIHLKHKKEQDEQERSSRILKAIPDAFLFEVDGQEAGTETIGGVGHSLMRFKFRPNPKYSPPSQVEELLTGMEGYLLVDAEEKRIAKIDGTLFKSVGFGWGILGHLDKGGKFLVEQANVGHDHWEATHMNLAFTGKVLYFKSLNIKSSLTYSSFVPAPNDLTLAQGIELLRRAGGQLAEQMADKTVH